MSKSIPHKNKRIFIMKKKVTASITSIVM